MTDLKTVEQTLNLTEDRINELLEPLIVEVAKREDPNAPITMAEELLDMAKNKEEAYLLAMTVTFITDTIISAKDPESWIRAQIEMLYELHRIKQKLSKKN